MSKTAINIGDDVARFILYETVEGEIARYTITWDDDSTFVMTMKDGTLQIEGPAPAEAIERESELAAAIIQTEHGFPWI